jgi:hypothetical protein
MVEDPDDKPLAYEISTVAMYHHDSSVRLTALSVLKRFKSFNPNHACRATLKEANSELAIAALKTLNEVKHEGYKDVIRLALDHPDQSVQLHAAEILALPN